MRYASGRNQMQFNIILPHRGAWEFAESPRASFASAQSGFASSAGLRYGRFRVVLALSGHTRGGEFPRHPFFGGVHTDDLRPNLAFAFVKQFLAFVAQRLHCAVAKIGQGCN